MAVTSCESDPVAKVVVIEDEATLAMMISAYLTQSGFETSVVHSGTEGVRAVRERNPDVVILDLGLPGLDGIEVCRRLRTFTDCYILVVTARNNETDTLLGLTVGADDYITKPFSVRELVARVQTVLRRPRTEASAGEGDPNPWWVFGDLHVDPVGHQVHRAGREVLLTPTERGLLMVLAQQPAVAFSRRRLMEHVWGEDWFGDEHLVDVHIAHLRRKLGDSPERSRFITTVRGVGYRMGKG